MEILKLESIITKLKKKLTWGPQQQIWTSKIKKKIRELDDRSIEIIQPEEKKKNEENSVEPWQFMGYYQV